MLKREIELLFQATELTAGTKGTNCTSVLTSENICRIKANIINLMNTNPAASVMETSVFSRGGFNSYIQGNCSIPLPSSPCFNLHGTSQSCCAPQTHLRGTHQGPKFIPLLPNYRIFSSRSLQLGKVKQEKSGDHEHQKEESNFQACFVGRSQKALGSFCKCFLPWSSAVTLPAGQLNSSFSCPPTKISTKLAPTAGCLIYCLKKPTKLRFHLC